MFIITKIIKYIFYGNRICYFLRGKILSSLVLASTTAYFSLYNSYKNEWGFFIKHPQPSELIFMVCIASSFVVIVLKAIGEWYDEKQSKNIDIFQKSLIKIASILVKYKVERLKEQSPTLRKRSDIFNKITQPKDQINIILNELGGLIENGFGLKKDELCITIMEIKERNGKQVSNFAFTTQNNWNQTKPQDILKKNSAAKECLETGEVIFYPDKKKQAKNNNYYLSKRDNSKSNGKGSVYCYPSFTKTPDEEIKYILSIVTYGRNICYNDTKEEIEGVKEIFNDICRRIDLELTLKSIKDWNSQ